MKKQDRLYVRVSFEDKARIIEYIVMHDLNISQLVLDAIRTKTNISVGAHK